MSNNRWSALRLVIDSVYIPRDNASPFFRGVKAPDKTELEVLVQRISQPVGRCLERQGLLNREAGSDDLNLPLPEDHDPMAQLLGSSVNHRIAVGPQQGKKAFMLQSLTPLTGPDPGSELVAKSAGFSLHAGVNCEAHQLEKRERLCRYISRPPVAVKRLSLSRYGKVVYQKLVAPGHDCRVVAPSQAPQKPGDQIKADGSDAITLAQFLRSGDLTAVWVPDKEQEAMRDLTRARGDMKVQEIKARQQLNALVLRHGRSR